MEFSRVSRHAGCRVAQRGFTREAVEALYRFGHSKRRHGADVFFMDHKARQRARAELGAKAILIPPYTPRWNGKIERFFGTARREWSHSRTWPDSTARDRALASFLRFYNRRRPHSAANGRAPITRVH